MKQREWIVMLAAAAMVQLTMPSVGHAGGVETIAHDGRSAGRANAVIARADDPLTLLLNPAGLGTLPGTQTFLGVTYNFAKTCFARSGTYDPGWGTVNGAPIPYQKICNKKGVRDTFIPSLAISWRLSDKIGMAVGAFPPVSERSQRFGDQERFDVLDNGAAVITPGWVRAPAGYTPGAAVDTFGPYVNENGERLLPAGTAGQLLQRELRTIYPMIGFGVAPFRWFKFGVSFGTGILVADFASSIRLLGGGEDPSLFQSTSSISVKDWFAPRVVASVHFTPLDSLDIVVAYRWDDDFRAKGSIKNRLVLLNNAAGFENPVIGDVTFTAPRPWWVSFAIRYGHRIRPRRDDYSRSFDPLSGRVDDHFSNEHWDIELNVTYENNSDIDGFRIESVVAPEFPDAPGGGLVGNPTRPNILLARNFQDQLAFRLGGDWNILPGTFAVRAGVSFETDGYKNNLGFNSTDSLATGKGSVDFLPMQKTGLHAGFTYRKNRWEVSGAYTRYWYKSRTLQAPADPLDPQLNEANLPQISVQSDGSQDGAADGAAIVNAGTFTKTNNILSMTMRYFFK